MRLSRDLRCCLRVSQESRMKGEVASDMSDMSNMSDMSDMSLVFV